MLQTDSKLTVAEAAKRIIEVLALGSFLVGSMVVPALPMVVAPLLSKRSRLNNDQATTRPCVTPLPRGGW